MKKQTLLSVILSFLLLSSTLFYSINPSSYLEKPNELSQTVYSLYGGAGGLSTYQLLNLEEPVTLGAMAMPLANIAKGEVVVNGVKVGSGTFATTDAVAIDGTRAIDRAQSYENAVRSSGLTYAEREYSTTVNGATVRGVADDITTTAKGETAVEAKYVDDWDTSLRNPQSAVGSKPWAVAEQNNMINQAQKYSSRFEGGVIYHTNSVELATHYTDMFTNAGIKNFEFIITPIK